VFYNLFLKTHPFPEAMEALKKGRKIRRKGEKKGFFKSAEGKYKTFWRDDQTTTPYCLLTLDDVFANDWIIDA
jgi:hypothetical protein